MVIAHIAEYYEFFGGLKTHINKLIYELNTKKINSIVIAITRTKDTFWDKQNNILWINYEEKVQSTPSLNSTESLTIDIYLKLRELNLTFDVIHAHSMVGYLVSTHLSNMLNCPNIYSLHGGWAYIPFSLCTNCKNYKLHILCSECINLNSNIYIEKIFNFMQRKLHIKNANKIIVFNSNMFQFCVDSYRVPYPNIALIKHWIKCPEKTKIREERKIATNKWKINTKNKVIFWPGSIRTEKKIDIVFKAFNLLIEEEKNVELWIAGISKKDFLSCEIDLTKEARRNVRNLGVLNSAEMSLGYAGADIFWQPSVRESVSYVLLEAMSYGLPIIAVKGLDNKDYVKNGYNCILVEGNNYKIFARSTNRLLENSELRRELSANSVSYVEENLDSNSIVEEIINIYNSLIPTVL